MALALMPASARAAITATASTSSSSSTASLAITKPTGVAVGTVEIATVSGDGASAFTAPSNWTLIRDTTSGAVREMSFFHVAASGEPTSYAFTSPAARASSGGITNYSGVNATVPIDASADTSGSSGTVLSASVTTSSAADMVITAVASEVKVTFTQATGTTERYDVQSGSTTQEAADQLQAVAGASAALTVTPSKTNAAWAAQTIALRDAATAGLSMSAATSASFSANLDNGDQTPAYSIPLTVTDTRTGGSAGLGWNLTITSTTLTTGTASLSTSATRVTGVSASCLNGGICVSPTNGTTYPVTVPAATVAPTAVKFASIAAGSGEGGFSVPVSLATSVPQNSFSGTYSGTFIMSVVSGP